MDDAWHRFLTVNEYHDGPVFGLIEVDGSVMVYDRQWDDVATEYGQRFLLSPIAPDLRDLILEDWTIWLRWDAAFKRREVDQGSHPALPTERARHEEIKTLIGDRFESLRDGPLVKFGLVAVREGEWAVKWLDRPSSAR